MYTAQLYLQCLGFFGKIMRNHDSENYRMKFAKNCVDWYLYEFLKYFWCLYSPQTMISVYLLQ